MINSVKKMYSRKRPARSGPSFKKLAADQENTEKELRKPIPSPDFLKNLPKPPVRKKLRLMVENIDAEGVSESTVILGVHHGGPGEAARQARLSERERNLFRTEMEYEELQRQAAARERAAAERERNLRELEALLAAREALLEAREKKVAENPALAAGPALDQMTSALDQRERRIQEAQAALDEREKKIREVEQRLIDSERLEKMKAELERREKQIEEARQALREREEFLEQSENLLCEKGQMLVERETHLDQREEELNARAAAAR